MSRRGAVAVRSSRSLVAIFTLVAVCGGVASACSSSASSSLRTPADAAAVATATSAPTNVIGAVSTRTGTVLSATLTALTTQRGTVTRTRSLRLTTQSSTATQTRALPLTTQSSTVTRSTLALAGKIVGIDPGHNGRNYADPSFLNQIIWNGREDETCDTTGTETDGGYTEAQYNFNVATYLAADLRAEGATVVMTRHSNDGVGPCVTTRALILDHAHANVAIDIHADGGPAGGRGFAILEPVADGPNDHVIASSGRFGAVLRARFAAITGMPTSDYDGVDGISYRDDLAGLNLTTVPKVLIECGNMRNATDAAMLVTSSFQRLAAKAMAAAITQFLR